MPDTVGQSVLTCKANPSYDAAGQRVLQSTMGKTQPSSEFKREFTARVKAARKAKGLTQKQIGSLMGLEQDAYKQYEGRTLMPHELIPIFCKEVGVDISSLFEGAMRAVMRSHKKSA